MLRLLVESDITCSARLVAFAQIRSTDGWYKRWFVYQFSNGKFAIKFNTTKAGLMLNNKSVERSMTFFKTAAIRQSIYFITDDITMQQMTNILRKAFPNVRFITHPYDLSHLAGYYVE